jgi:para-nitrobenzyl esterase
MDKKTEGGPGINRRAMVGAGAASALIAASASAAAKRPAPVAQTTAGRVRGFNNGPVKVFRGVPYGASTAGANRWLPPKPPTPWTGVRDATAYGQACPQNFGAPLPEEQAQLYTGPMGEDCLTVNVYTPALDHGRRPVMVWFHGGGYSSGSGNAMTYDGSNLARKHGVVLVSVTHRLNVFGHLYLADLFGADYADSGNAGILDCVAALGWVRDNIANFGGDPNLVTAFGQSGGGGKVSTMMGMPPAKGLFHRAIAESGSAVRSGSRQRAAAAAKTFVDHLGAKTLAELQTAPQAKLVAAMNETNFSGSPIVDGRSLPADVFAPRASALSAGIPFLTGSTETELVFFPTTPIDPIDDATFKKDALQGTRLPEADADRLIAAYRAKYPDRDNTYLLQMLLSDWAFTDGVLTQAERKVEQGGAPVYVYYFAKHTPVRGGRLRAPHTLDVPYVFDNLTYGAPIIGPKTPAQQALADKVSGAWTSFARTGTPSVPGGPAWKPYGREKSTMVINDVFTQRDDPQHETRQLIEDLKAKTAPGG